MSTNLSNSLKGLLSLVNNRGQWQHNINVDANAWRLHIHHAELKAMIMSEGLGLNRYLIMGGVGTKQMLFWPSDDEWIYWSDVSCL